MPASLIRIAAAFAVSTLAFTCAPAQTASPLAAVLAQMDASSKSFTNFRADVDNEVHTKIGVIDNVDHDSGAVFIERSGTKTTMGATYVQGGKLAKVLQYDGATGKMFSPGVNQIEVFKTGDNQAKLDAFLTLAAGVSGKDLDKSWTITDQGAEAIGKVRTEKLFLVPKDAGVQKTIGNVTIWVDPARDISLKQVFVMTDHTTKVTTYSNVKLHTKIDIDTFAFKTNKDTRTIVH